MHNRSLSRELSLLSLGLIKDTGDLQLNKIQIDEMYDLNMNFFANNLLDQTRRNHASFVKDHVPLPGSSFGFDVSLDYKF